MLTNHIHAQVKDIRNDPENYKYHGTKGVAYRTGIKITGKEI